MHLFHQDIAVFATLFCTLAAAQEFGKCRFSNGTLLPNTKQYGQYAPCAETGSLSAVCCALIRDNEPGGNLSMGATKDECLPNGICQNRWTQSEDGLAMTAWFITYCTEEYTGGKCMNVCPQDSKITPCSGEGDSDKWCCGDSKSCCKSNIGIVTLDQILGAGGLSSSSSVASQTSSLSSMRAVETVTETAPASASASTTGATSTQSDNSKKQSGGAIAGIVVGAIFGIAWLGAGLWYVRHRLRRKPVQPTDEHGSVALCNAEANHAPAMHEVGATEKRQELQGRSFPFELISELDSPGPRPGR